MIDESSAIYQIFLRNFTPEGTFVAAIPRLEGIASMGFDWLCLTPIHPIGVEARKGEMGSPYAIKDYRAIDPELGTIEDFRAFLAAAHSLGLKVMMDVVFNHASPDSVLARENPEWFLRGATEPAGGGPAVTAATAAISAAAAREIMHGHKAPGVLGRKCAEWSDVVDFDYGSSPQLWVELMSILVGWREEGVDGFRCDVASLVPVDFWKQARQRVNQYDPGLRRERHPLVWLAESVHPRFLKEMRDSGWGAWSEPELHAVFDLSYDYDGWERLEKVWRGERRAAHYLDYLYAQETLYPKGAKKIRFLENHDQERIAGRFVTRGRFEAWTVMMLFIPGLAFAYMGQELALERKPGLFEKDPVDWASGDESFRDYFVKVLAACRAAKREAPRFSWKEVGKGVFLLERAPGLAAIDGVAGHGEAATNVSAADRAATKSRRFAALVNLEGWASTITFAEPLRGRNLITGETGSLEGETIAPEKPLILEVFP